MRSPRAKTMLQRGSQQQKDTLAWRLLCRPKVCALISDVAHIRFDGPARVRAAQSIFQKIGFPKNSFRELSTFKTQWSS